MFELDHQTLERLAYAAWLRRGQPIGSPEVDWTEACKELVARQGAQEIPSAPPGGAPTDLGVEPMPERSHDRRRKKINS